MIVASALLSRWFTSRIGSIMSLPYAAIGAGMLILPPLTQVLISDSTTGASRTCCWAPACCSTLPLVMLLPLGRMTAGSQEWRTLRTAAAAGTTRPWTIGGGAPHQRLLGTVRRLLFHRGGRLQRHAALGRLSHRARLRSAGCGQRVRLCRHALGLRHHRRRLAVGPLRPQADGNPLLPVDHHRHRRALPWSRSFLRCCWSTPSSSSSA